MKFIAFSDTHDSIAAIDDLISEIKNEKVDFFVHAGDVISPFALKRFSEIEKLYIAFGNNDGDRNKLTEIALGMGWVAGEVVFAEDIAVYHGTNPDLLKILEKKCNIVVTGHTHEARVVRDGSTLVINPGESCGYLTGKRSYAIYEDGEVNIMEF
ncbi:YfcE family phosphodiesterase [Geoglobus acetivorans]|uniref:Phosphoesterase n=1 Tax=Geoglobus acetivorans TaxID=565033 RepID=A0ABZ3H5C4_GEOAI|nr:metallophosphoesterase [Geoglobus acetivorans]